MTANFLTGFGTPIATNAGGIVGMALLRSGEI
jgi:hypothetical protein